MTFAQLDTQLIGRLGDALASQLPAFLARQRWFGSKARHIHAVQLADCIPVGLAPATALIVLARVDYAEGPAETYVIPLLPASAESGHAPETVVLRLPEPETSSEILLFDALADPEFLGGILSDIRQRALHPAEKGELRAVPEPALRNLHLSPAGLTPRLLKGEQSNSSIIYGDRLILKFFRRLEEGVNPDLEIGHFLTESVHFPGVPPLCGFLEYESKEGKTAALGILQEFIPNRGDGWRNTLSSLESLFELALRQPRPSPADARRGTRGVPRADVPPAVAAEFEKQMRLIGLLGRRTAELHLALASSRSDAAFMPEPFTSEVREALERSFHDMAVRNLELLRQKLDGLPDTVQPAARAVLKLEDALLLFFHSGLEKEINAVRTRIHGDYHLGQVLFTGSDFLIIDFEGEPAKPLSERRVKRSPLQDVAGMLRSFHYASRSASLPSIQRLGEHAPAGAMILRLARRWHAEASQRFLQEYKKTAAGAPFVPQAPAEFDALLKLHLLEKAIYELGYELNNRPAWLPIPLGGIEEILPPGH